MICRSAFGCRLCTASLPVVTVKESPRDSRVQDLYFDEGRGGVAFSGLSTAVFPLPGDD